MFNCVCVYIYILFSYLHHHEQSRLTNLSIVLHLSSLYKPQKLKCFHREFDHINTKKKNEITSFKKREGLSSLI